jgi:hypothetical protein
MTGAELLAVTEVERLALGPGDMLIVKVPTRLNDEEFEELGNRIRAAIPEPTKILVFEGGTDISVLRAV